MEKMMDKIEQLIKETNHAKLNLESAEYGDDLDENGNDVGLYFLKKARELAQTHNEKGLLQLLDYFDEEFDLEYEGVLEWLQNDILNNYSIEQICKAFYEKFNQLTDKSLNRTAYICSTFFWEWPDFELLRKMFNEVKANKSAEFLDELEQWIDDDYEVGPEGITILREDMKKW